MDRWGHIDRWLVEKCKSYEDYHELSPFEKFTCIIGPSGAGQSHIMNDISFCLGSEATQLRGDQLQDLVFKKDDSQTLTLAVQKVTIIFRHAQGSMLHVERTINAKGFPPISAFFCGQEAQNRPQGVGRD